MKHPAIAGSVLLGAVCLMGAGCSSDGNNGGGTAGGGRPNCTAASIAQGAGAARTHGFATK